MFSVNEPAFEEGRENVVARGLCACVWRRVDLETVLNINYNK